jgi:RNA polymerase sigma-70 factor, ECF subfamily
MFPAGTLRSHAVERAPDEALLRMAVHGDGRAFAALLDRHGRAASAAARAILGPTPAAEDAVQEALIQLWRTASTYSPERGSLRAYLVVLVRSRALDLLRRENVRAAAAERVTAQLRSVPLHADDELERRAQARDLREGMIRLPREQAQVLGLQYLAGQSQAEVASLLDVPLGTVKGRTRLGLARLRRELAVAAA